MSDVKVKLRVEFFIECPNCKDQHDVDTYECGVFVCSCGESLSYDNRNPDSAEIE